MLFKDIETENYNTNSADSEPEDNYSDDPDQIDDEVKEEVIQSEVV